MKRFFYMIAAAAFVFAACEREIEPTTASSGNYFPDGKVKVSFTATYPDLLVETKVMQQAPVIDELYVALFGSEGSFQAWIKAQTEGFTTDYVDHTTKANYVVYLPITDRPRRLHFIANPPKDEDGNVIYPVFGDEDEVINAMIKYKDGSPKDKVNESEDAYWQKIVLDQIDADPRVAPDANGYYRPSTALNTALNDVCLVRNYAKVHVKVKEPGEGEDPQPYELEEYALINVPGSGSVAPWNTGSAQYEPMYMDIKNYVTRPKGYFYERLSGKYFGYMPNMKDIITTCPAASEFVTVTDNKSDGVYMYERTMFNRQSDPNTQTGFLAKIRWTEETEVKNNVIIPEGKEYWYKIEIHGADGEYIPFLRSILYSIVIEGINETGYESAKDAADGDFAGDISIGLALSSLNELSNGASTIRVNHTEFTSNGQKEIIDGVEKVPDYVIEWQYFPTSGDASGTPVTTVGEGTIGDETYDVTVSMYDLTSKSAIDCNLSYLIANQLGTTTHDGQTWGTITVPISELGEHTKTSVVRISGQYGTSRRIFREVIINVVSKQDFVNVQGQSTDPTLPKTTYIEADEYDGLNKKVVVHFSLPDSLGASLFPLNIKIESSTNNLTSTSPDLPVNSGVSAFNDANNSFYFIRQVTLDEYRSIEDGHYVYNNDFTATLFTNKVSGNSTDIRLSDEKGFMNPETLTLTVNKILSADPESQTVSASAISATVNVTANVAWEIEWVNQPTGWSYTTTSNSINFTFPANTSETDEVIGSVIVKETGASTGKVITVKQKSLNPPQTETFNTNSANFPEGGHWEGWNYIDDSIYSNESNGITLAFSAINSRENGHLRLSDNTTFTITSTSATITNVIIHYTGYQYGSSGRNGNYSSSNPATTSGYVYATNNGDTGTWTGSASSITFTMRRSQNQNTIRISSIEVTYRPE